VPRHRLSIPYRALTWRIDGVGGPTGNNKQRRRNTAAHGHVRQYRNLCGRVVQRRSRASLATHLVAHFGMGAALGSVLGSGLVRFNVAHIGETIASAFNPGEAFAMFMGSLVLNFATGAALTGYVLIKMDETKS
jgi:hypothetical protein